MVFYNGLDILIMQGTVSKIRTSSGMFFTRSECHSELSIHAVAPGLMPCHEHMQTKPVSLDALRTE